MCLGVRVHLAAVFLLIAGVAAAVASAPGNLEETLRSTAAGQEAVKSMELKTALNQKGLHFVLPLPCDPDEALDPPTTVCGWSDVTGGIKYQTKSDRASLYFTDYAGTCEAFWNSPAVLDRHGRIWENQVPLPSIFEKKTLFLEAFYGDSKYEGRVYTEIKACARVGDHTVTVSASGERAFGSDRLINEAAWMMNQGVRSLAKQWNVTLPPEEPQFSLNFPAEQTAASARFTSNWVSPEDRRAGPSKIPPVRSWIVRDASGPYVRIEPPGFNLRLPEGSTLRDFQSSAGYFTLNLDYRTGGVAFYFYAPLNSCADWEKELASPSSSWKRYQRPADASAYDSRWNSNYFINKSREVNLCLDRPGGSIQLTAQEFGRSTALRDLTLGLANGFLPGTTAAQTASSAAQTSAVSNVYPLRMIEAARVCKSGGTDPQTTFLAQLNCDIVKNFNSMRSSCMRGEARYCTFIADQAAKDKDYTAAAAYYQQACDLGDKKSCGRAEDNKKKAN